MAEYRKKPVVIEATQWFKNGDHPEDQCEEIAGSMQGLLTEGKVVRFFCRPDSPGDDNCKHCGALMHNHGWIDTLEGGNDGAQVVCPGDWIITGVKGERYPCKPDVFAATYEPTGA